MCSYQNGHQLESPTFKVMIEKRFVLSYPYQSFPSRFWVADMTFCICLSYPSQTMSSPCTGCHHINSFSAKNAPHFGGEIRTGHASLYAHRAVTYISGLSHFPQLRGYSDDHIDFAVHLVVL